MGSQDSQLHNILFVLFCSYFWAAVPRLCLHAVKIPYSGIYFAFIYLFIRFNILVLSYYFKNKVKI